jgi:hypothetical protein
VGDRARVPELEGCPPLTHRSLGKVAFCEDGNIAVGKLSGALADDLGERCRRADNVGVGDDIEQGDGVGG